MRILILLPTHAFPTDTGQRHRYGHLARYLARRHDVALVYLTAQPDVDQTSRHAHLFAEVVQVTEHGTAGSPLQRLGAEPSEVFLYRSRALKDAVSRIVARFAPDVLISGEPALTQYVEPYPNRVRVLDYICEATLQFERMRSLASGPSKVLWALRKAKYAAFLRRIAGAYDLCIVNSAEDRVALRDAAPQWRNVELIPNGLDLDDYPRHLVPPEPDTMIYPGSIVYDPNRDAVEFMAREILPRIRSRVPRARFLVTGKVPESLPAIEADGVEFTGYLPDVKAAIAGAWVCTVPLRLGAGGARFKVLESLALGCALVSTAIGYEGVGVSDGVDVLAANDAATFADRCVRVLTDPPLRRALGDGGRLLIEREYDWARLGARLDGRLRQLCEDARRKASS